MAYPSSRHPIYYYQFGISNVSAVIANSTEENKKERKRNIEIDRLIDREKSTRRENLASE